LNTLIFVDLNISFIVIKTVFSTRYMLAHNVIRKSTV